MHDEEEYEQGCKDYKNLNDIGKAYIYESAKVMLTIYPSDQYWRGVVDSHNTTIKGKVNV